MNIISKTYFDQLGNLFFDVAVHENGTIVEKRIPAEDYLALFKDSLRSEEKFIKIPKLPENIMAAQVSSMREDTFQAVVLYKAERRAFCFMGQHYLIPMPALIAQIHVEKGVRKKTCLFALTTDEPKQDTPLMYYPFGNVSDSGLCCYGNIVVKEMNNVLYAPAVLDAFLYGDTNGDHWHEKKVKKGTSQGDLVELLAKRKTFPTKWLVESNRGTVGQLCEFKKGGK